MTNLIATITFLIGGIAFIIMIALWINTYRADHYTPKHLRSCPCSRCQRQ